MPEARAVVESVEKTRRELERAGAVFESEYEFTDMIFAAKCEDFSKEFVRLRMYKVNNWTTKGFVLVQKQTHWSGAVKKEQIVLKKEFDSSEEAMSFIQEELKLKKCLEFSRVGFEYTWKNQRVFVENIECLGASMEVEGHTAEEIERLFSKVTIGERAVACVPELVRKAKCG